MSTNNTVVEKLSSGDVSLMTYNSAYPSIVYNKRENQLYYYGDEHPTGIPIANTDGGTF
jgi:hypothetical protein